MSRACLTSYTRSKASPLFRRPAPAPELYFYILAFSPLICHNDLACSAWGADVHQNPRKEVFIIANQTAKYHLLTAAELQELISQVQQDSAEATARLCEAFRPLIYREGSRESIYRLLGEDAISIAWEIFLRFIRRYNGSDFINLPGLIRCHVHYELLHEITRLSRRHANEVQDDGSITEQLAQANDELQRLTLRLGIRQAFTALTPLQQAIISASCLERQPTRLLSRQYGCTCANILKHRRRGLMRLRSALTDN